MPKLTIAVAGTTSRTLLCLEALKNDPRFEIAWVLTPTPKPVGRKQALTPNPVDEFAQDNALHTFLIESKLNQEMQQSIELQVKNKPIDFLLVVDFGYLVPDWLLKIPKIAPVNIHPSALPKWRGSAPGQFALLFGEKESAVTLMVMNEQFDGGPIIAMLPFDIQTTWTTADYYKHSFALITPKLAQLLVDFAKNQDCTPQPLHSPTPVTKRITKDDAFVPWHYVKTALQGEIPSNLSQLSPLFLEALNAHKSIAHLFEAATRALQPWPGMWTIVLTENGEKRMKIISARVENNMFRLEKVQIEGKNVTNISEIEKKLS